MWELLIMLMLVGALAMLIVPRLRGRGPRGGAAGATGTLLVTGVSPRPDAVGQQFVTITGVITGPTVNEHVVYQRMAVDVEQWPTIGALHPVTYSPKNPDNWRFAPADTPENPEAPPPSMPPGSTP